MLGHHCCWLEVIRGRLEDERRDERWRGEEEMWRVDYCHYKVTMNLNILKLIN